MVHEPLLARFREQKAFAKKITKAVGRHEKLKAQRLDGRKPVYKLDHLIRERYPMFVDARTEEEQEALDDGALPSTNLARKLMHDVRRRKGLHVSEDRAVAVATKQRTRARKK